jgi:hypothetical protein
LTGEEQLDSPRHSQLEVLLLPSCSVAVIRRKLRVSSARPGHWGLVGMGVSSGGCGIALPWRRREVTSDANYTFESSSGGVTPQRSSTIGLISSSE